jgi:hypothetical protein
MSRRLSNLAKQQQPKRQRKSGGIEAIQRPYPNIKDPIVTNSYLTNTKVPNKKIKEKDMKRRRNHPNETP